MKSKIEMPSREATKLTSEQCDKLTKAEQKKPKTLWEIYYKERKSTRIILYDRMNELEQSLCVNLLQALESFTNSNIKHPEEIFIAGWKASLFLLEYKAVEYVINYHKTEDNKIWVKNLKYKGNALRFYMNRSAI
jgi:hypothetical protein